MERQATLSTTELEAVRHALGPLQTLDYTAVDIVTAHARLGAAVGPHLHRFLARKLSTLTGPAAAAALTAATTVRQALEQKMSAPALPAEVRAALRDYWACLLAWADGAHLKAFTHPALAGPAAGAETLALLLQDDASGCQTGVFREASGAAILWHAEEDGEAERFDRLRLFAFRTPEGQTLRAFIYPDLLPGSTFAWGEGVALGVDSLYVKETRAASAVLANIAAWVLLRLNQYPDLAGLLRGLGPYRDGYAATLVRRQGPAVVAEKYEFAGEHLLGAHLPREAGRYLFQVNVFADRASLPAQTWEAVPPAKWAWLGVRPRLTRRLLAGVPSANGAAAALLRLLASRAGGAAGYANVDVKGHLVCRVAANQTTAWVGAGPALRGERPLVFDETPPGP